MSTREQVRVIGQFCVGAMLGALIWALSEPLLGTPEPWDANVPFYLIAVAVSVCLSMLIRPKSWPVAAFAVYLGQVIYITCFYHPRTAIILPAWISVGVFGLIPSFLGCCLGWLVEGLFTGKRKTF
ncbi:hypothetical protein [Planctomicrobium sp. SH527]|uniref:hypothetical protein n=1 Tax=Planctomicrobium sp. SH527 TaxID=3448123 RepID=UPI003F5C81E3